GADLKGNLDCRPRAGGDERRVGCARLKPRGVHLDAVTSRVDAVEAESAAWGTAAPSGSTTVPPIAARARFGSASCAAPSRGAATTSVVLMRTIVTTGRQAAASRARQDQRMRDSFGVSRAVEIGRPRGQVS